MIEHFEDVIVADASRGLRFALESRHHVRVARERRMQNLDRDATLDLDVLALEDRTHPTLTEETRDPVLPLDNLTWLERHEHLYVT